jgi:hypothetical protein
MGFRLALPILTAWLCLFAQMKMSVQQLTSFLQSSIKLKHDDRKVAAYLKNIKLTEKLDDRTIEDLQGQGLGPKTVETLKAMAEATNSLPKAAPPPPKPVAVVIPPPSKAEQEKVLAAARDWAMNYTKRLPDFICTQVTRRYADPSGLEFWHKQDVVTAKLSYFEQKEDYKVILVNSQPVELTQDKLGGSMSWGEFGSMMKEVFEPESEATFEWSRWTTLRGRRNHVYAYRVTQPKSRWHITYEHSLDIIPGYRGQIYVDADTLNINKIKMEAENIPASFPVQQASIDLDYDLIEISGNPFILPLKHTMRMRTGKLLIKNEAEFRLYRKFGTESTIKFDTPEALPDDNTKEQPPK